MVSQVFIRFIPHLLVILVTALNISSISCLYEDQIGKFDWRRQFIGLPKFVHHQQDHDNVIIGTESNVIASLHLKDGSILWRQLLPKECNLDNMYVLNSSEDPRDYLIRTSCKSKSETLSHIWSPLVGLLVSEERYKELSEGISETTTTEPGHDVGNSRAYTLTPELSLLVSEDGRLVLKAGDRLMWEREESLAYVTAVEIVRLPLEMRDRFGLRKKIILVTEIGKIFGLDTFTGNIDWKIFDKELSTRGLQSHTTLIVSKQANDEVSESEALVIHPQGLVLRIDSIEGKVIEKKKLSRQIKQIAQTDYDEADKYRGVIMLDVEDDVVVYPDHLLDRVKKNIDKYYMTVAETAPPSLSGYRFIAEQSHLVPKKIWYLPLNETEKIVGLGIKRIDEEVHSPARVLGDRGILYKYLNPNLIAVMTQGSLGDVCSPEYYINIYLVDGVTGSLVHLVHHPKSRGPSYMVHSENWLVYSYYNTKSRRTEISSLEMFEGTTQANSSAFSSLTRSSIKPRLIEHKSFIFPGGIDAMVDTVTLRGMTNRHIIVALPSGALLEIPKIFLDPRRPINMLMEHREEGLVPYMPELVIPSESMINYDQSLMAIKKITTSPAILESTSLVFAYGLDLFFTRVTPSKTFDILKDDFDHILIAAVLIFLVVASYVSKLLAQRKALHAAWK